MTMSTSTASGPETVDQAFVVALPKVELHAHLTGSINRTCLHEIWVQRKREEPDFAVEDPLVAMPDGKVDWDINTFFPLFSSYIYNLCSTLPSIRYSTLSVLSSFYDDGVRYLELRTTPRAIPTASISKQLYVSTVLQCIDEFAESHPEMKTYLLLSIDRRNNETQAIDVISLAKDFKDKGVIGIDLCGDPAKGDVSIFEAAFAEARACGLKLTLHFAEIEASGTDTELQTLLSFQPDRLGHVIHVPDQFRQEIARRKLGLELCLSCNVHAKMIPGGFPDHHFGYWKDKDCPITLCTDDVGVFCSPTSNEYLLAAEHFHLNRKAMVQLCRRGIDSIFGDEVDKRRLQKLLDGFETEYL